MKNSLSHFAIVSLLACAALVNMTSCDPKLDFDNIDPSAKVGMALALPVGEISVRLGDFLNDTTVKGITVMGDGVYQYKDTFSIQREFHKIDLSNYFSQTDKNFKVSDAYSLPAIPGGVPVVLEFPLTLDLSNVNNDVDKERLDEMFIDSATFYSTISPTALGIQFSDIQKLEVLLPEAHFTRSAGLVLEVPLAGFQFDEQIPIKIDDFVMNLMADKTATPSRVNVVKQLQFTIRFTLNIQSAASVDVTDDSFIHYNFGVSFLDYSKIHGFFTESNDLHEDDTIVIAEYFDLWKDIHDLRLPIADPTLQLDITTSVAAPLWAHIYDMEVIDDQTGEKRQATFGEATITEYNRPFDNYLLVSDPEDATVTNKLIFDKTYGDLDALFSIRPDRIYYKYDLRTYDVPSVKQHRLTRNTKVDVDAILQVPFRLGEGTDLSYSGTSEVNMEQVSIDSLVSEIDQIDSITVNDIRLVLTAESYLPLDVIGSVFFLDEDGKDLGIKINETNEIKIAAPTEYNGRSIAAPGKSVVMVSVDQQELDKLARTRSLQYNIAIKDPENNKSVPYPIEIGTFTSLKIKVAVAADVAAYLQLAFDNK